MLDHSCVVLELNILLLCWRGIFRIISKRVVDVLFYRLVRNHVPSVCHSGYDNFMKWWVSFMSHAVCSVFSSPSWLLCFSFLSVLIFTNGKCGESSRYFGFRPTFCHSNHGLLNINTVSYLYLWFVSDENVVLKGSCRLQGKNCIRYKLFRGTF